jgi:hypothetical protein
MRARCPPYLILLEFDRSNYIWSRVTIYEASRLKSSKVTTRFAVLFFHVLGQIRCKVKSLILYWGVPVTECMILDFCAADAIEEQKLYFSL